ncbi:WGR domain-containing protein [Rhizobium sp. WL3]|uniref:WGR domain-containing protein n=1 Tax=Rhizobium sp. WL3 TaxID=2603277 RepID=UPI0032B2F73C
MYGDVSVIRNWGRIGSGGQTMMATFEHQEEAKAIATSSAPIDTSGTLETICFLWFTLA